MHYCICKISNCSSTLTQISYPLQIGDIGHIRNITAEALWRVVYTNQWKNTTTENSGWCLLFYYSVPYSDLQYYNIYKFQYKYLHTHFFFYLCRCLKVTPRSPNSTLVWSEAPAENPIPTLMHFLSNANLQKNIASSTVFFFPWGKEGYFKLFLHIWSNFYGN